jgi:predicted DNA-binding transcriptional regulator YafY
MNRTDRLVSMVMLLQSRRVTTARFLADHFEITERTVYRDLAALGEAGVPLLGEAGVGYTLMRGYHLPPVMFSSAEAMALVTGATLTERMSDAATTESIRSAMGKLTAVLPAALQARVARLQKTMLVRGRNPNPGHVPLSTVQQAISEGCILQISYAGASRAETTNRTVEPLGLVFYLDHWHLIAWCRLRESVRDFRIDRILKCTAMADAAPPRPNFHLKDHLTKCMGMTDEMDSQTTLRMPKRSLELVRRHWGPSLLREIPEKDHVQVLLAYRNTDTVFVAHWILGFGSQATVLEPANLRQQVAELARLAAIHHAQ